MKADQEREQMQKVVLKSSESKMAKMVQDAMSKNDRFMSESERIVAERKLKVINDNSKRAFMREFKEVVEKADVILQVLDARDPLGCRVREVEEMIRNGGAAAGKRIVLVLNKIDLVPKDALEGQLKYLRREFPTVAFKASTQTQRTNIGQISGGTSALGSSECLGADTLVQLLKNYSRSLDIKTAITVGVVGYPNVGKSSLINSLKRSKVCRVGATPGITTAKQEIHLDKNIKLLDCPGIVFSGTAAVDEAGENSMMFLRNCLRVEQLDDPITPVQKIVENCNPQQLMAIYGIPQFSNAQEFLLLVAKRQGKLKKGGIANFDAAARSVLNDWNQGKIPYYTAPPAIKKAAEEASFVSSWAPEFDLSGIEKMEVDMVLDHHQQFIPEAQMGHADSEDDDTITATTHMIAPMAEKNQSSDEDGYEVGLTAEEARCNPQSNKERKKALKKAKKAASRPLAMQDDDHMMDVEAYNFTTDFNQ